MYTRPNDAAYEQTVLLTVLRALLQTRHQQHEKEEAPSLIAFSPRNASPMQTAPVSLSGPIVVASSVLYTKLVCMFYLLSHEPEGTKACP